MSDNIKNMTPKEIVAELDKYIIGQDEAKKYVAIALRNRYRRSQLSEQMREEVSPKNILMMGPTGVGKTEIARRLAKLMDAPFVKVEATKFTEVGYVGRDVDSMIRDLVEASMRLSKQKRMDENSEMAEQLAEDIIVKAIIPGGPEENQSGGVSLGSIFGNLGNLGYKTQKEEYDENKQKEYEASTEYSEIQMAREQVRKQLKEGLLEDQIVEIEVDDVPKTNQLDQSEGMIAIGNIFDNMMPKKTKRKKCKVSDARRILKEQEAQKMIDMDQVTDEALQNAEQNGIIFIDEIDKIASGNSLRSGADVSREGVQRDILPIVEGSVVNTKYGPVKTDHMLFIGAGAFHVSKPSDLIPELQGRFPINVELQNLDKEDFKKILTVPQNAATKQQKALLETEGVNVEFTDDAIDEIANLAYLMNEETENIGARRLHTILEILLEDISYNLPDPSINEVKIDREYVQERLREKIKEVDVDKYIL